MRMVGANRPSNFEVSGCAYIYHALRPKSAAVHLCNCVMARTAVGFSGKPVGHSWQSTTCIEGSLQICTAVARVICLT